MKKNIRRITLYFLILSCLPIYATTEFWFAVPWVSEHSRATGGYHIVLFSYNEPTHICISMPANSTFVTKEFDLPAYDYIDLPIAINYDDAKATIETPFNIVSQRGIHITSSAKIGGYYHHTGKNAEIFSLKEEALGTNFLVPTQISYITPSNKTYAEAYSSAQIVATEDNTHIQIKPLLGHTIGLSCSANTMHILLNRGETYAIRSCDKNPIFGMNGTKITSDKPIAVTTSDDSTKPLDNTNGADLNGDQLVPLNYAGTDYVVIGQGKSWNQCYITALEDNTTIQVGDETLLTLMQNECHTISMDNVFALFIQSNKPIIVYQLTGDGDEAGGAIIPSLYCTGSKYVTYKRALNSVKTIFNIVVHKSDINDIVQNGIKISSSQFHSIAGTEEWVYASISMITSNDEIITTQSNGGNFQLGILDLEGPNEADLNSCSYGYFSDYDIVHEYDEYATFNKGEKYDWRGHFESDGITIKSFNKEGIYIDTLTSETGCDSICILHLNEIPYPDNVDTIDCVVPPIATNFEMKELYRGEGAHSMSVPLVGDIDGDGTTEIVACSASNNTEFIADRLIIYNGMNGLAKDTINTVTYALSGQPIAMADVDGDSICEFYILGVDMYIYCYSNSGSLKWKSLATLDYRFVPMLADINNDSSPELICGKYIFNATTGALLLEGSMEITGMGFAAPNGEYNRNYYLPYYLCTLTDIDGDGSLEICAGNTIYKVELINKTGKFGNQWKILRKADEILGKNNWNYDGQTIIIDIDSDGDEDICVIGVSHNVLDINKPYSIDTYVWDGQTSQIIAYARMDAIDHRSAPGWKTSSIPFAGDINGDGKAEIIYNLSQVGMVIYSYNMAEEGRLALLNVHQPFAETAGFTVFDFNMDDKYEIVYRGDNSLSIVDGTTLNDLCTPKPALSITLTEYPVVADVNGDGTADILITYTDAREHPTGCVGVFSNATTNTWSSARSVWNQWAYNSININDNMTIPRYQYNIANKFPNNKQPFNSFLAQKPLIDKQGDIFVPAADVHISSASYDVINDSIIISLVYCNIGDARLVAPYEIALYQDKYRSTSLHVDTINDNLNIGDCDTIVFKIPTLLVCQSANDTAFIIAVNDDGHGIAQHGNQQAECDTTNNIYKYNIATYFHSDTTHIVKTLCTKDLPYSDEKLGVFIFNEEPTNIDSCIHLENQYGCDSIISIHLTIQPCPCDTVHVDVYQQFHQDSLPYVWHDFVLSEIPSNDAHDTVAVFDTINHLDCDSITTLHLHILEQCEMPAIYLPIKWNAK